MPKVMIVGGDGLIGSMLVRSFARRGWEVVSTSRRAGAGASTVRLDLGDPEAGSAALPSADVAVFAAAMARFADCRAAPDLARAVNVDGPVSLAERFARGGTRSVLISTSAVFDGSRPRVPAEAPPSPTSLYGALKAEAEAGFLRLDGRGAVVRLTKVLDVNHGLFTSWRDALGRGEPVGAFADLRLAPISLADVETAVLAAAEGGRILQVSASRDVSYHEAAIRLAEALGRPPTLVTPQSAAEAGIPPGDRPAHTSLDGGELASRTAWTPPEPADVIKATFVGSPRS